MRLTTHTARWHCLGLHYVIHGDDFEVLAPRGDTLPHESEIWRGGVNLSRLLHAKFHPINAEVVV